MSTNAPLLCLAFTGCVLCGSASAGPWAEVGDASLRSDIEILANAGVIDDITMQWPIPWAGILGRLDDSSRLGGQPDFVRQAAERVAARGMPEAKPYRLHAVAHFDATDASSVVRAFDGLGRADIQGQVSAEYMSDSTSLRLSAGAQSGGPGDHQSLVLDGSYLAQRFGWSLVHAGYTTHWWGPGWVSALSLSNNARPMPQIGISRIGSEASHSPLLSWLGPWQAEILVGVLDGQRIAENTGYVAVRLGFKPLPHLELGLSRTTEICGSGHTCNPLDYLKLMNDSKGANKTNDEGTIDIRYGDTMSWGGYTLYAQFMNEDTNPIYHSDTSHLAGASVWIPVDTCMARLTVEYASSKPTRNIWGGSAAHGIAYNNYKYVDGMRYRGRTLGFSLDSDSTLFSVLAAVSDAQSETLQFSYHHAAISDPKNTLGNAVTVSPVSLNLWQVRLSVPFALGDHKLRIDVEGRYQDDQPRPKSGGLAAVEIALTAGF